MNHRDDSQYELEIILSDYLQELIMKLNLRCLLDLDYGNDGTILWVENITIDRIVYPKYR